MKRAIKQNTHPGEILNEEVMIANNLTIDQACDLFEIDRDTFLDILEGKSSITPIATRIANIFGGNADLWIRLQAGHDRRAADRSNN